MARKQRAEQWTEYRRQREEEERQCRVAIITEFAAIPKRRCTLSLPGLLRSFDEGQRQRRDGSDYRCHQGRVDAHPAAPGDQVRSRRGVAHRR